MRSLLRFWPTLLLLLGLGCTLLVFSYHQEKSYTPDFEDGYLALQRKEYDSAIQSLNRAVKKEPENPQVIFQRGRAYFGNKAYDLALADYNQAIQLDNHETEYYLGRIILNLGHKRNLDQALADANSLRAIVSKNPWPFRILAHVHLLRKEFKEALEASNEAVKLGPKDANSYLVRAEVHAALNQFDEGIRDCSDALKIEAYSAEALRLRGYLLYANRMVRLAYRDLNQALEMMPLNAENYSTRATVHFNLNKLSEALSDWNQAIYHAPRETQFRVGRGKVYLRLRNYPSAIADFEESTRQDPDLPNGYEGLAYLWATAPDAAQRNGQKAVVFARKAIERSPRPNAQILSTLASAYAETNDFDKAIQTQQEALKIHTDFLPQEFEQAKEKLTLYQRNEPFRDRPLP